jgi:hypothetical protein
MAEGVYMYAVAPAPLHSLTLDVEGLGDQPVRTLLIGDLTAVVSDVPLDEFGGESLRRNLQDLQWVSRVARTHYAVAEGAARHGPVAPLRLTSICRSDASVRARVDRNRMTMEQALARVAGRVEWSVEAIVPSATAELAPTGDGCTTPRRTAPPQRHGDVDAAAQLADELHVALTDSAVGNCLLAPHGGRSSAGEGTMILNAAYLVESDDEVRFLDVVTRLRDTHPGTRIQERGPWTPYSFATLDPV